jgi:hypothetical protein
MVGPVKGERCPTTGQQHGHGVDGSAGVRGAILMVHPQEEEQA